MFSLLEKKIDVNLKYNEIAPRESDQKFFVANLEKITKLIGWQPAISAEKGIEKMIEWISII